MGGGKYVALLIMTAIMLIAGYFIMTAMLTENKTINLNKIYMVLLMALAGVIAQVLVMHRPLVAADVLILGVTALLSIALVIALRRQEQIGDEEFLKAMIEHHGMALVMAGRIGAKSQRADVRALAAKIESAQKCEIGQMREMLQAPAPVARVLSC
jgi:hypothetical protein